MKDQNAWEHLMDDEVKDLLETFEDFHNELTSEEVTTN